MPTPKAKNTLLQYLRVQENADRLMYDLLQRTASSIERDIKQMVGQNIGAVIRREQMIAVKKELHLRMARLLRDGGLIVAAKKEEAAAAAIKTFGAYDQMLMKSAGVSADFQKVYLDSATKTAQAGMRAAEQRLLGTSYIQLSKQVYRTEALANGIVDRYVDEALAKGLSAAEFAKGVRDLINPAVRGGVSYAAQRLARTEINNAFHAVQAQKARETPWTYAVKWNLSGSHPTPDECNSFAEDVHYDGGQPGFFRPADIPVKPHPNCLCFTTPETDSEDEFLDNFFGGKYNTYLDKVMRQSGYTEEYIALSRG